MGYGTTEFFVLRPNEELSNRYLYHTVRSKLFRLEAELAMTGAVGQQRVPKKYMQEYIISLPPLSEQKEIVRILESLLERERQAEEQVEEVLEEVELMKKAILAKAFRGQLGTNDPTEESAKELLKSILKEDT